MKFFKLAFVSLAVLSFAIACNNAPTDQTANTNANLATPAKPAATTPAATPDELADARSLFKGSCSRCHKEDGTGGPVKLDDGTTLKVPNLHDDHSSKHTDDQLSKKIQNGGDGMPRFKDKLDQQKIDSLVRFIRHDFQNKSASAPATGSPSPAR